MERRSSEFTRSSGSLRKKYGGLCAIIRFSLVFHIVTQYDTNQGSITCYIYRVISRCHLRADYLITYLIGESLCCHLEVSGSG
jgi:hypothetical protein